VWWNNGSTNSSREDCGVNWTAEIAEEGENTWIVYINDTAGNVNSTSVTFTIDTTAPTITIKSPVNNSMFNTSDILFNITTSETASWCGFSLNGTSDVTMDNVSSTNWNYTYTGLNDGWHNITFTCNDSYSNYGESSLSNFYIDTVYPDINFTDETTSNGSTQAATSIFVNVTANDSASNISTFIDFDNSLVGWWRMDDVNASGDVVDISGHCYDNETEILTENGWKLFKDLNKEEKVMTLDNETGEKEWQLPAEKQKFDYNKEMYKIELEDGSELLVSEKHNVYSSSEIIDTSSLVLKTLTLSCLFNNFSSDHKTQLNFNASAKYGESLVCSGNNLQASDTNSLNSSSGINLILLSNINSNLLNSSDVLCVFDRTSSLLLANSINSSSGAMSCNLLETNISSESLVPLISKENNSLASTTTIIYLPPLIPNFSARDLLTFLPSLNASSCVISDLDLNSLKNSKSAIFCMNASLATSDQFIILNDSILRLSSSGTDTVILDMFNSSLYPNRNTQKTQNTLIFKSFGLEPVTKIYKEINEGKQLYFLNSENQPIKIRSITKQAYNGKIYDVDVENDIVLVRRKNSYGKSSEIWSGNSNNGTAKGNATQTDAGYLGKGFSFDGNGDYVNCGNDSSLNINVLTISAWINLLNTTNQQTITTKPSSYYFEIINNKIRSYFYGLSSEGWHTSTTSIQSNRWEHVVVGYNGTNIFFYIDGVKDATATATIGTITTNSNVLYIGGLSGSRFFNGTIDDVMIFNRSLSAEEIQALYANQSTRYLSHNFTDLAAGSHTFKAYTQDYAGNVNYTELRTVTVTAISSCQDLSSPNTEYTLTDNIINDSLAGPCINITAENITLDCAGFYISSDDAQAGVYSNQVNTTINNCNVSMGNASGGYGVYLYSANSSIITNSTLNNQYYGIYLLSVFNSSLLDIVSNDNLVNPSKYVKEGTGIFLNSSGSNMINNITSLRNWIGIQFYESSSNICENITAQYCNRGLLLESNSNENNFSDISTNYNNEAVMTQDGMGFRIQSSSDNTIINLTANLNPQNGLYISSGSRNIINNFASSHSKDPIELLYNNKTNISIINIFNCTSSNSDGGCIYISYSNYTSVSNGIINLSYGSDESLIKLISLDGSIHSHLSNLEMDTPLENITYLKANAINNTFINCSYNTSKEYVATGSQLIRKWYYKAYINDTAGNNVTNANVTAFNVSGTYNFNLTTDETGYTALGEIIDYVNNGTRIYSSNYTIYADNQTLSASHIYNATYEENNYKDVFTLENFAPNITYISSIANTDLTEENYTDVQFNVTVYDENGASDINVSSVVANFSRENEAVREGSCVNISGQDETNSKNFSCTIEMWYFDENGDWNITVYAEDNSEEGVINDTEFFQVNLLQALKISPTEIFWTNLAIGSENQTAGNTTIINNTGNYNATGKIRINATNLYNGAFFLDVGNISVGLDTGSECNGTFLEASENITISGAILERGNLSLGAYNETLYYCITLVPSSIPSGTYDTTTEGAWTISLLLAAFTVSRRRRRNKNKNIEHVSVPATIFISKLGALEAIVKYLKENWNFTYSQIASILYRNQRTIWTAYQKSKEKRKERIENKNTSIIIPCSIFKRRELTILEAITLYLKEKGLKYSEIAKLVNRDQRNIWMICSRAEKKSKLGKGNF